MARLLINFYSRKAVALQLLINFYSRKAVALQLLIDFYSRKAVALQLLIDFYSRKDTKELALLGRRAVMGKDVEGKDRDTSHPRRLAHPDAAGRAARPLTATGGGCDGRTEDASGQAYSCVICGRISIRLRALSIENPCSYSVSTVSRRR